MTDMGGSFSIRSVPKKPVKVPGELCTTINGAKLVYVDSTVPQTSPMRVSSTPFTDEDIK